MPGCCSPPKQRCFVLLCPHFVRSCRVSGGVLGCGEARRGKGGRLWCLSLDPAILSRGLPSPRLRSTDMPLFPPPALVPCPAQPTESFFPFGAIRTRHGHGMERLWTVAEMLGEMCPRVLMLLLLEIGSCDCIFRFLLSYPTLMQRCIQDIYNVI